MSNTSWNTTSYNPITGYTNYPGAWIYNYINNPSIATNNWVNTNEDTYPAVPNPRTVLAVFVS